MNEKKHTPHHLRVTSRNPLVLETEPDGELVAEGSPLWMPKEAGPGNIRRLAACWNACIGIPASDLESGQVVVVRQDVVDAINDAVWALENMATTSKATALERLKEAQASLTRNQTGGERGD